MTLNMLSPEDRAKRQKEIIDMLNFKPKMLQRKSIIERAADKIRVFIDTLLEGEVAAIALKSIRFLVDSKANVIIKGFLLPKIQESNTTISLLS